MPAVGQVTGGGVKSLEFAEDGARRRRAVGGRRGEGGVHAAGRAVDSVGDDGCGVRPAEAGTAMDGREFEEEHGD